jgi:hypothetical protein
MTARDTDPGRTGDEGVTVGPRESTPASLVTVAVAPLAID